MLNGMGVRIYTDKPSAYPQTIALYRRGLDACVGPWS
jgi:hypothetical protein